MADCSIILYLECLKGLIYHFKKLGQRDLNKKMLDSPLRRVILVCSNHFDLTYFQ